MEPDPRREREALAFQDAMNFDDLCKRAQTNDYAFACLVREIYGNSIRATYSAEAQAILATKIPEALATLALEDRKIIEAIIGEEDKSLVPSRALRKAAAAFKPAITQALG